MMECQSGWVVQGQSGWMVQGQSGQMMEGQSGQKMEGQADIDAGWMVWSRPGFVASMVEGAWLH